MPNTKKKRKQIIQSKQTQSLQHHKLRQIYSIKQSSKDIRRRRLNYVQLHSRHQGGTRNYDLKNNKIHEVLRIKHLVGNQQAQKPCKICCPDLACAGLLFACIFLLTGH